MAVAKSWKKLSVSTPPVREPGGRSGTPRYAWRAGIWVIERQSKPSTLSRTLSRALNITVATVIAGQVQPIRTTVEQPYTVRGFLLRTHG